MKLPVLPSAWPDECPVGFVLRVAHRNGWPNPNSLISALGGRVNFRSTSRSLTAEHLDLLSVMDIDIPDSLYEICSVTQTTPKRYRLVTGLELEPIAFREDCSSVCIACLKDSPYVRQLWSLNAYSTCHIHGIRMLRCCPKCDLPLTYHRGAPHVCSCGADFTDATPTPGDITEAGKIFRWIETRDVKQINTVSAIFRACCEAFGSDSGADAAVESGYLYPALSEQGELVIWLASQARRAVDVHPRLLLLPFLRTPGRMRSAAIAALKLLDNGELEFVGSSALQGKLSRRDASHALGVEAHRVIAQLGKRGLLSEDGFNDKARGAVVSRDHVNKLLRSLYRPLRDRTVPIRALTSPLSSTIVTCQKKPELVLGYDLAAGLTSLRLQASKLRSDESVDSGYLSLSETAARLDVHKDVVRTASRLGLLQAKKGRLGTSPLVFNACEVAKFDAQYAFGSALARSVGVDTMKFSTKLFAAGLRPVAGPPINGLQQYLFDRSKLARVDLKLVAVGPSMSFSEVTRLVEFSKRLRAGWPSISLLEIAADLSLTHADVCQIERSGWLKRVVTPGCEVRVCEKSYRYFVEKFNDPNLIEISAAAVLAGQTLEQFRSEWIDTEFLKVTDFGVRQCVERAGLLKKFELRKQYITAREAARLTNQGRHFLPNLESRGAISAVRVGTGRKIRLFKVSDVKHHGMWIWRK